MNDKKVSKFNIPINEESPDSQFQEDLEELQSVKLNRRITRLSILIISLTGAIILFAYMDLKNNLDKMNRSGNTEIQVLSKGVQSKFSSLSLQQAKFEEILAKTIAPLEKAVASMQKYMKETSTAIKQIRSARYADNKKAANAIETINKTLVLTSRKLEALASDMGQTKQKYTDELSSLSRMTTDIKRHIQEMQAELNRLSSSQLDKNRLEMELSNERKILQKALGQLKSNMENRLSTIEKKIRELEKIKVSSSAVQRPVPPKKTPSSQHPDPKPVENTHLQPGAIIEQDIQ
ncbi:MAG: hypothetical protein JSV38_00820 [Desulfobacterales bacterium]|nr:MAG: hypothetical protein JSV38_00820 [Desulfobacterales bacterium]